jgi:hypothetical protein
MSIALQLYIQLIEAKDDETRARVTAEAFDALETRLTQLTAQPSPITAVSTECDDPESVAPLRSLRP